MVRNINKFYIDSVSELFTMRPFLQHRAEEKKKDYWCIKDSQSNPVSVPGLDSVTDWTGFVRCFIEMQGIVDFWRHKDNRGNLLLTPRLRIYGQENDLKIIMEHIPAKPKKIQYIHTQTGDTCMLSYLSPAEISDIMSYIDGIPHNESVWEKWESIFNSSVRF